MEKMKIKQEFETASGVVISPDRVYRLTLISPPEEVEAIYCIYDQDFPDGLCLSDLELNILSHQGFIEEISEGSAPGRSIFGETTVNGSFDVPVFMVKSGA